MTQKQELLDVKARLENRLKDTDLTNDQRELTAAGLRGVMEDIAALSQSSSAAAAPAPKPTPAKKTTKRRGKMTDDEKEAFKAKMAAAKAAKAKKEPASTPPAPAPKDSGKGKFIGIGRIECDFDVYLNDSGKTVNIPNINGTLEAKSGDYAMYLRDSDDSFTVIKKSAFGKRCVIVEAAPSAKPAHPAPQAAKEKDEAKDEQPKDHAHEAAKEVVKEMAKQGCEVHKFLKDTKNTPLDAWLQGKILEYTTGKTDEWIDRVYIDTEHGDFYAKIIYKSATGWFSLPKYVKVCPERGIETVVAAKEVEGKKYRSQYGKDKLRALYHYPENVTGCRSLAKEIYQIRKDKGDSLGKYHKYVEECRNDQWSKEYKGFIRWMHEAASLHRKNRPSMSHGEALSHIAKELRVAAK